MSDDRDLKFLDGKHCGEYVMDVIESDPSYCHFILFSSKSYVPRKIKALLSNHFTNPDDYYMNFGPFKTKTLNWIQDNEPEYIDHLKKDEYVRLNCTKLYQKLKDCY